MNLDFSNFNFRKLTTASLLSALLVGGVAYQQTKDKDTAGLVALVSLVTAGGASAVDPRKKSNFPAVRKKNG